MPEPRPPLAELPPLLRGDATVRAVVARAATVAVPATARAVFVAALAGVSSRRPLVVAVPTGAEGERLAHDLGCFLDADTIEWFPAWETLPFERVSPSLETMGRRLRVLWRLRHGGDALPRVVVAPVRALVQRLGPHVEDAEPVAVRTGQTLDRDELVARLVACGYRREYQVESRGEVAVRGSIVDVYPVTDDHPVRIDLWGDDVERLSAFSVADQRSTRDLDATLVFPARELLATPEVRDRAAALVRAAPWGAEQWERLAAGQHFDGMESWLPWLTPEERLLPDLLGDDALVLVCEPTRLRDRAQELVDEEAALAGTLAQTWGASGEFPRLSLPFERVLAHTRAGVTALLAVPEGPDTAHLAGTAFAPLAGDTDGLARRLRALAGDGYRVVLAAEGRGSADRLTQVLAEDGVDATPDGFAPGVVGVTVAAIDRGVVLPEARLALVAEADLTGRRRVHRAPRGARRSVDVYDALEAGDYVVHQTHGVARYGGMVQRAIGGVARDYLLLEYKGGDKLYVPTDQVGVVRRYTGGETPTLHRMGGADFERTKSRVRAATREIAQELIVLYRRRLVSPGHPFSPDTPWQREVEEAFPFEETPDQAQAIEDVKRDMEAPRPMDRLVCGDVGFGKTEVALRAAFKAVQDGKQVAVLVPTTLLASQHGQTFRERFANYPVRVEVLSRFLTTRQQRSVATDVATGAVDVVIGTHRLLSDDIAFHDLGLLVIDEEQRFGVQHKEQIKALRTGVDVLALSATPIPRTLELSITGIRDLSMVNTPPEDRQPILTYVGEDDDRAVAEAIRRELLREGQAFFVHNQVKDIDFVAEHLRELVPEARLAVAHGQMDEARLERVVLDFWEREYDVLVCTTIVESGLDIPTVNTLVVDRADRLGLAQLYQLRGRVRSARPTRVRVPAAPGRPCPLRGGLRAVEDDRRVHRPRLGLLDRHAGPGAAWGREPAGRRPVGPHRRRRLRPLLPVRHRGGERAEGRTGARAGRGDHRPSGRRPPAPRLRDPRRRAHGGLPAPRRGARPSRRRRRARRVGGPLRAAAAGGDRAARRGPAAGRVRAPRDPQRHGRRRRGPAPGPRAARVPTGAAHPPRPRREGQRRGDAGADPRPAGRGRGLTDRAARGAGAPRPGGAGRLRRAVKRLPVLVAALALVALVGGFVAYVSLGAGAPAFSVNGHAVSQADVDGELRALADNTAFARLIHQSGSQTLAPVAGSISSSYAAGWLSLRIAQVFVDDTVARQHLGVTASDRSNAEALAVNLLGSVAVVGSLPASFRTSLRSRFGRIVAVERVYAAHHAAQLRAAALQTCPSRRFVAHILVSSQADAQAIQAQLAAGADFATLARGALDRHRVGGERRRARLSGQPAVRDRLRAGRPVPAHRAGLGAGADPVRVPSHLGA